jgi:hypothetical protein
MPNWAAPDLAVIRERGLRHEAGYVEYLAKRKNLTVMNLAGIGDDGEAAEETQRQMQQGAEVIAQGALGGAEWFGRPDILRRVANRKGNWDWSYEVVDTKLARETKAATILQLSFYSELLEEIQGCGSEWMWVIPPAKLLKVKHIASLSLRRISDILSKGWVATYGMAREAEHIQSPLSTATFAAGFESAIPSGVRTITCLLLREFCARKGHSWKNGARRQWRN